MDNHQNHQPSASSSVTSGVDLSGTPISSPSLVIEPDHSSRRSSLARRRSWGNDKLRDAAKAESSSGHPLHLDPDMSSQRGGQDPFSSNHERPIPHYVGDIYSNSRVGTSRASLMREDLERELEDDGHREDDQAHLTANMSRIGTDSLLLEEDASPKTPDFSIIDPEVEGASTPRTRRRTRRYSTTLSPLKKTETAIKSVSRNLRRMSLRVVNLANTGLEGQLKLGDGNQDGDEKKPAEEAEEEGEEEEEDESQQDLKKIFPIRGRALGFLGPKSKIRLALFNFLVYPCVSYSIFSNALIKLL